MKNLNLISKSFLLKVLIVVAFISFSNFANAQFNKSKLLDAAKKSTQAVTLSDAEIEQYTEEYMVWSDSENQICQDSDPNQKKYSDRLKNILGGVNSVDGKKLDIQVYYSPIQNAFACANGSIRVYAGLMDIMSDDELFGIIGHEVGHIVNKDTKDAFKKALLTSALLDAVGSTGKTAASLTSSQLGSLAEAFASAQFSQKAEYAADDYGYEFLKKNGKDPKAMASSLRNLQKLFDDAGTDKSKITQLFSTHPESGKRAERLEKK
jgi:putative metalloprotease